MLRPDGWATTRRKAREARVREVAATLAIVIGAILLAFTGN